MKASIRGDVNDLKNFRRKMLRLRNFGTKDFIRIAQDTAAIAVRYAKGRVPVKTGALKNLFMLKKRAIVFLLKQRWIMLPMLSLDLLLKIEHPSHIFIIV